MTSSTYNNYVITEQPTCCFMTLNNDFNCLENYCEFSLCNFAKSCYLCKCGKKYITNDVEYSDNNAICGFNNCKGCYTIPGLILAPFTLLCDILCSPCKTFLYCEKCMEKRENVGTASGMSVEYITNQPYYYDSNTTD